MDGEILTVSAVLGVVMPVLVSFLKGANWSTTVKTVLSLAVSAVAGFATVLFAGDFNTGELLASIGVVFTASQVTYNTWFKGTTLDDNVTDRQTLERVFDR